MNQVKRALRAKQKAKEGRINHNKLKKTSVQLQKNKEDNTNDSV